MRMVHAKVVKDHLSDGTKFGTPDFIGRKYLCNEDSLWDRFFKNKHSEQTILVPCLRCHRNGAVSYVPLELLEILE